MVGARVGMMAGKARLRRIAGNAIRAIPGIGEFAYNVFQQKKTWDREDTAYSRAIEDMRNAGVNPQLFTGSAAPTGQSFRPASPVEKSMQIAQMQAARAGIAKVRSEAALNYQKGLTEQVSRNHLKIMNPMIHVCGS